MEISRTGKSEERRGAAEAVPFFMLSSFLCIFHRNANYLYREMNGLNRIELLEEFLFPFVSEKTVDPPDDIEYFSFGKFSTASEDSYGEETAP